MATIRFSALLLRSRSTRSVALMASLLSGCLLALCTASPPAQAQNAQTLDVQANVRGFTTADGLSNDQVLSLQQDKQGFLWIGTRHGLNRFDGHRFKVFTRESHGLQSNIVNGMVQGPGNWMALLRFHETFGDPEYFSIDLIDTTTERIQTLQHAVPGLSFGLDELESVESVEEGLLFLLDDGSIYLLNEHAFISRLSVPQSFRFIAGTKAGHLFGHLNGRHVTLSFSGEVLAEWSNPTDWPIQKMVEDQDGTVWAMAGRVVMRGAGSAHATLLRLEAGGGASIVEFLGDDPRDYQLYAVSGGAAIRTVKSNRVNEYDLAGKKRFSTNGHVATRPVIDPVAWEMDDGGALWIGDHFGLRVVDFEPTRFRTWFTDESSPYAVRGMVEDGDHLLVMSRLGLRALDLTSGDFRTIMEFRSQYNQVRPFVIKRARDGRLLAGGSQIMELTPNYGLARITNLGDGNGMRIWSIAEDRDGRFWAGLNFDEIAIVEPNLDEWRFFDAYNGYDELRSTLKFDFLDIGDHLWVAAQNGLYLIDKEHGVVAQFNANADKATYLPAFIFHHIHEAEDGSLWLATGDGGLIHMTYDPADPASIRYEHVGTNKGLPSLELYGILPAEDGSLWMSSANGLIHFDPDTENSIVYFEDQGISSNEFNRLSFYAHSDGRMFFGGLNGITSFNPADFEDMETYAAPLRLADAALFSFGADASRPIRAGMIHSGGLTLEPGDSFITLDFALQDFYYSTQVRYEYRIPGLTDTWTSMRDNRLQLAGLPYGTHTLEVQARGKMNLLSSSTLSYTIEVLRPFYLRTWFVSLALFTFLLTLWQYTGWRNRSLVRRQEVLERMVDERTRKIEQDKKLIEKQSEQLREQDRQKTAFFQNISHELRTPLTLIMGPLEMVLRRGQLEDQDQTLLSLMRDHTRRLHRHVNELLDLSRIDAVQMAVHPEPVALYPFVKRILALFEGRARMQEISLQLVYELDHGLRVMLDTDKVEKVLYNLLSNAIKYNQANGTVTLTCRAEEGRLLFRVKDSGIGISADDLPKIFDRFHRVEQNEYSEGTGIGLSLCKELAVLMKGSITASSTLGEGSSFDFRLLMVETFEETISLEKEEEHPLEMDNEVIVDALSGDPILVVEDNASMQRYLTLVLDDFDVRTAGNGKEALDILNGGFRPALIISDIMMPVMDGMDLLSEVRQRDAYRTLPVIMLTARSGSEDRVQALRIGVDDYLTKPFVEEELLARVRSLIRNSRSRMGAGFESEVSESGAAWSEASKTTSTPTPTSAPESSISQADLDWLERVETLIMEHVGDRMFGIDQLADRIEMSTRRVQQKIKAMTGLTPKQYQREIQLEAARRLLESGGAQSVSEVSSKIGFSDAHYFSGLYEKRFGKRPSEYL